MPEENVFHLITQEYYQLTASEKKLASFVMANGQQAQSMSISEMADACDVAKATISRFCRRMGYDGYSAFRLAIATATAARPVNNMPLSGEVSSGDSIGVLSDKVAAAEISAINETKALIQPQAIQRAVDILQASDKVLCMGQGASMLMAEEMAHLFMTAFSGYFAIGDSHTQIMTAANISERDTIFYFSYSGSTKDLQDVLHLAKKRGAKILLVTRYPRSPGAEQADLVLQCGFTESPLQLGSVPARMAQLYLIDVLFSEMCRRDMESCKNRRKLVADALADKHL